VATHVVAMKTILYTALGRPEIGVGPTNVAENLLNVPRCQQLGALLHALQQLVGVRRMVRQAEVRSHTQILKRALALGNGDKIG